MDKPFFGIQIDRLRSCYSAAALNDERVQLFWREFKDVPNHVFQNAIDYLIRECTTQALPAMSRFIEAMGMFRTSANVQMQELVSAFQCDSCRDFGYRFDENTVVACDCPRGMKINPKELARAQTSFDKGAKFISRRNPVGGVFQELPYDPAERISKREAVVWK
jgi:hypothetical protein